MIYKPDIVILEAISNEKLDKDFRKDRNVFILEFIKHNKKTFENDFNEHSVKEVGKLYK